MKKLFAGVLAVVMSAAFAISANAATPSDLISRLKADGASATQIALAEDYLKSNGNQFTSAQLDAFSAGIDRVFSLMKEYGVSDPSKLPASAKKEVKDIIAADAPSAGIAVSFGKNSAGVGTMTLSKNGSTYTIAANDLKTKTTGAGFPLPAAGAAVGLCAVLGSAAYLARGRKKAAGPDDATRKCL